MYESQKKGKKRNCRSFSYVRKGDFLVSKMQDYHISGINELQWPRQLTSVKERKGKYTSERLDNKFSHKFLNERHLDPGLFRSCTFKLRSCAQKLYAWELNGKNNAFGSCSEVLAS